MMIYAVVVPQKNLCQTHPMVRWMLDILDLRIYNKQTLYVIHTK